jgi:hypothetical protein
MLMVFNVTFNNISVISWWSFLLVEETEVPGENHRAVASHENIFVVDKYRGNIASSVQTGYQK